MELMQSSKFHSWFRGIAAFTVLATFALMILGGVVRVTESGLGCPDWPGCYGGLLPPLETKAIIEFSHRVTASFLVGPLILFLFVASWIRYRKERWIVVPASLAFGLVIVQALLGGATVLNELSGEIVMAHLAVAEALVAVLVVLAVVAYRGPLTIRTPDWAVGKIGKFPILIVISGFGIYILLLSGSYVTTSGAFGACTEWPLCNGDAFPEFRLQMNHMFHRYVAGVVGLFILYALHLGFRGRSQPMEIRTLSITSVALFTVQVIVGAWVIWGDLGEEIRALHLALATAVWIVVSALVVMTFSSSETRWGSTSNG